MTPREKLIIGTRRRGKSNASPNHASNIALLTHLSSIKRANRGEMLIKAFNAHLLENPSPKSARDCMGRGDMSLMRELTK